MFYYTYKVTNLKNGKFYIGVHKTKKLDDGYMGSGVAIKMAIEKYGKDNFSKDILRFHEDQSSMYNHEKELVNDELVNDPNCYNIMPGGLGGFDYVNSVNSKDYIAERNKKASCIFQEKLKDEEFYNYWRSRVIEGIKKSKNKL